MSTYSVLGVASLMKRAVMATTYKPALLKALVRVARQSEELTVPLPVLGEKFAEMYWNQVIVHRLKQAPVVSKESEIVREVRSAAERSNVRNYRDLSIVERAALAQRIAPKLRTNVLGLFHKTKPDTMEPLYGWNGGNEIAMSAEAHTFLKTNALPLEMIANYRWAEFLEVCNRFAPRVILKIAEAKRRSLQPYMAALMADGTQRCFYCDHTFDDRNGAVVDHFVPWSFSLEDTLWDLVLCCRRCNTQKSDWLPEQKYVDKILERNASIDKKAVGGGVSLLRVEPDLLRLYDAAISAEWPRFWSPR